MQVFKSGKSQLPSAATDRLQKLLAGRENFSGPSEPAEVLVTPPPQAIRPILKIVVAAVVVTAGLVWLNRPTPAPETISLYELTGSRVFRTDLMGDLAIVVEESKIRVATRR